MCGVALVVALAGCGKSSRFVWREGTLTIPASSSPDPTTILGIKRGSEMAEVRRIFGAPQKDRHFGPPLGHCWLYRVTEKGTDVDYVYFCFGHGRRVTKIAYAIHM
jgi:hypothetical protein